MARPTREEIIPALNEAGVEFPETASIAQLRTLYQREILNREQENEDDDRDENGEHFDEEEIDRQLRILRKQRELTQLKAELGAVEQRHFDFHAFEAMVHHFSGDDSYDILKWFGDIEDTFDMLGGSERDKFVSTRRVLKGTAKSFVDNITSHTYDELKQELVAEFHKTFTMQDVFKQLEARKLQPNESIQRYVIEMQKIARRVQMPEAELVRIIINGLNDKSGLTAMLYTANTMQSFKALLGCYEKVRAETKLTTVMKPTTIAKPLTTEMKPKTTIVTSDLAKIRCYNCGQLGHYSSSCVKPKRPVGSCFVCSEMGHRMAECPKRNPVAAAIDATTDTELAEALDAMQLVCVAFINNRSKCNQVIKCLSLFDSGSINSFVRVSEVPWLGNLDVKPKLTTFRGVGNGKVTSYGTVKCKVTFGNITSIHDVIVIPDDEAVVPLLIGREFLNKLGIGLYQVKKSYLPTQLLEINKMNNVPSLNKKTLVTLDSFDLLKSPILIKEEREAPPHELEENVSSVDSDVRTSK